LFIKVVIPGKAAGTDTIPTDAEGNSFLYHDQKNDDWEVYISAISGGAVNLSNEPGAVDAIATFSPDGQWVAFVSNRDGAWAIWAVPAAGGSPNKLFDISWGAPLREWQNERISWGQ
jgi:Tol biopolymer transport system component